MALKAKPRRASGGGGGARHHGVKLCLLASRTVCRISIAGVALSQHRRAASPSYARRQGSLGAMETKLRARIGHAGISRDPVGNFRFGGCVADKRLALGCRSRADPCQLALYVHCCHAHEQEAGGYRFGSGRMYFAKADSNLGTIARSPNQSRRRCYARLSVGDARLMDVQFELRGLFSVKAPDAYAEEVGTAP
jgi:hypothetical protein